MRTDPELRPSKSSPYKSQSQVTFTATSPLYEYSSPLAYGLAIAMTALIVIADLTEYVGGAA